MPDIVISQGMADLLDQEAAAVERSTARRDRCLDEHGYGCARPECGRGPATSADMLELDAVPEAVDSDTPAAVHARTLARARP